MVPQNCSMSVEQGDKAYADAEKKLKGSFMGIGKDPDAAVDSFKTACNNYKVAGSCAPSLPPKLRSIASMRDLSTTYCCSEQQSIIHHDVMQHLFTALLARLLCEASLHG